MQMAARRRVSRNGSVIIPASFRRAIAINPGDEVVLKIKDGELCMTKVRQRLEDARRLVRQHVKPGTSLVDELIAERRKAAKQD